MHSICLATKDELQQYCIPREGEQKIGQTILLPESSHWTSWLANQKAKFVILGIPEDIGVRANNGIGGAQTTWNAFLNAFLNIQDNTFFKGKDMILLGTVDVKDLMEQYPKGTSTAQLKEGVEKIDALLSPIIESIINARKIPILIGGGHNNAYPLLKGLSLAKSQAVNAINLDAHADFRSLEGRHSGNGFSYAYKEGLLKNYAALGLHQAYNNSEIIAAFDNNKDLKSIWFEAIFLQKQMNFAQAIQHCLTHVDNNYFGVELDLDCIEDTLSSAQSPVGISRLDACEYLYQCGQKSNAAYLHLCEAVAQRADGLQYPLTGKLLSYLVQAFIKGKKSLKNN